MTVLPDSNVSRSLAFALLTMTALSASGCTGGSTPPAPVRDSQSSGAGAEAKAPAGPVMGKLEEKNFHLVMQAAGTYKAGQQGEVEVVLEPKGAFHCNKEYPYKMKLGTPPVGVTYPTAIVRAEGMTLTPEKAVMKVPFVAEKPGEVKLAGNFFFSVCTSEQCVIDNRELAVLVKVE